MSTLTWRPGTLLPYTSLWLTLRKLAYLNKLRISDFPLTESFSPRAKRAQSQNRPVQEVDLGVLARLIGEPVELFSFCDRRFVPDCWQFLFTPQNGYCPKCLELGYHTRLFSLKLLNQCPIHEEPLHVECSCMNNDGERVDAMSLAYPNACHCSSLKYFDPARLHGNDHRLIDTEKLKPLADWLISLSTIYVTSYMDSKFDALHEKEWLIRLKELCEIQGFAYPSVLIRYEAPNFRYAYRTQSIQFRELPNKPPLKAGQSGHTDFWRMSFVPTDIYKSLARYLRRHVIPRSDYWVWQFRKCITPEAIAALLRSNLQARLAFIELIWARTVEPTVDIRRWDGRKKFTRVGGWYSCKFSEFLGEASVGFEQYLQRASKAEYSLWVRSHVFGQYCLAIWKEAERFVEYKIRQGRCTWSTDDIRQLCLFQITVTRPTARSLEFTSYVEEPLALTRKIGRSKSQRVLEHDNIIQAMKQKLGSGLCLTWSERDGWHTAPCVELSEGGKIHHVSIAPGRRIKSILVYRGGYFYLRLVDYKIQVFSVRTSDLFGFMRQRFAEFCKMNKISISNDEHDFSRPLMDIPSPIHTIPYQYKYFCEYEINRHGFCESDRRIEAYRLNGPIA
jgi:hypothetical protein